MPTELPDFEDLLPRACLNCGAVQDAAMGATPATDTPPDPGDMSVCSECACVMIYTAEGFRRPTDEELAEAGPLVRRVVDAVLDSLLGAGG